MRKLAIGAAVTAALIFAASSMNTADAMVLARPLGAFPPPRTWARSSRSGAAAGVRGDGTTPGGTAITAASAILMIIAASACADGVGSARVKLACMRTLGAARGLLERARPRCPARIWTLQPLLLPSGRCEGL
jgi:hypothetical protein